MCKFLNEYKNEIICKFLLDRKIIWYIDAFNKFHFRTYKLSGKNYNILVIQSYLTDDTVLKKIKTIGHYYNII